MQSYCINNIYIKNKKPKHTKNKKVLKKIKNFVSLYLFLTKNKPKLIKKKITALKNSLGPYVSKIFYKQTMDIKI